MRKGKIYIFMNSVIVKVGSSKPGSLGQGSAESPRDRTFGPRVQAVA